MFENNMKEENFPHLLKKLQKNNKNNNQQVLELLKQNKLYHLTVTVSIIQLFLEHFQNNNNENNHHNFLYLLENRHCLTSLSFTPSALQYLLNINNNNENNLENEYFYDSYKYNRTEFYNNHKNNVKENNFNPIKNIQQLFSNNNHNYNYNFDALKFSKTIFQKNNENNKNNNINYFSYFLLLFYSHPIRSLFLSADEFYNNNNKNNNEKNNNFIIYNNSAQILSFINLIAHLSGVYPYGEINKINENKNKNNNFFLEKIELSFSDFSVLEKNNESLKLLQFFGFVLFHEKSSLKEINLNHCFLGDKNLYYLFSNFANKNNNFNQNLKILSLNWNLLKNENSFQLLQNLQNLNHFELCLEGNFIVKFQTKNKNENNKKMEKKENKFNPTKSLEELIINNEKNNNKNNFDPLKNSKSLLSFSHKNENRNNKNKKQFSQNSHFQNYNNHKNNFIINKNLKNLVNSVDETVFHISSADKIYYPENNNNFINNISVSSPFWIGIDGNVKNYERQKYFLKNGKSEKFDPFYFLRNAI